MELRQLLESDKVELSARDICNIIKEGRRCGASTLEYGNLRIKYFRESVGKKTHVTTACKAQGEFAEKKIPEEVGVITEEGVLLSDTVDVKERQLEEYLTLEPEKFEELLMEGDLDEVKDEEDIRPK